MDIFSIEPYVMPTSLVPTPDLLRAETARHRITNEALAAITNIDSTTIAAYKTGRRRLYSSQANVLARAINTILGHALFLTIDDETILYPDMIPETQSH